MDRGQEMDNPVYRTDFMFILFILSGDLFIYFIGRQVSLPGTLELKWFSLHSFASQLLLRLS